MGCWIRPLGDSQKVFLDTANMKPAEEITNTPVRSEFLLGFFLRLTKIGIIERRFFTCLHAGRAKVGGEKSASVL